MAKKPVVKPKIGRPTKYSPTLGAAICAIVERDGWLAVAAESMGIHRNSAYAWVKAGESGEPDFVDFVADYRAARAKWTTRKLGEVQDARWLLEKADRELFGKEPDSQVNVNVSQTTVVPREEAMAELRTLAANDPDVAKLLAELKT